MRCTIAQLDPTVGDLVGNAERIVEAATRAASDGADVLVTPELSVIGYPPRDLLVRAGVVAACEVAAATIADRIASIAPMLTVLLGHPRLEPGGRRGVRNSVTAWREGRRLATIDKRLLPGYDVFDEDRYFDPGTDAPPIVEIAGQRTGIVICEDLWRAADAGDAAAYDVDPLADLVARGIDVLVAMNASPFVIGKGVRHEALLADVARRAGVPVVSVNQVGANDDLVFDGRSTVRGRDGIVVRRAAGFASDVVTGSVPVGDAAASGAVTPPADGDPSRDRDGAPDGDPADAMADVMAEVWDALVLATREYVTKTGHRSVVLGLSGGIDSAVVAAIAVAALGPSGVQGVSMPSRYSSDGSRTDAEDLADRLGIALVPVPIESMHAAVTASLVPHLEDDYDGLPDENVQARLRGIVLMTWSNARNALVLATSNKAELATGYSTLYGDMCGALAPIGDLSKGRVFDLARWVNDHPDRAGFARPPIPTDSITKPPSAELRPDQRDDDTLPPYEVLDRIVSGWVEHDASAAQLEDDGIGKPLVDAWAPAIDRNEYKRFQAPVVPKVTSRAFGPGRPMPIVMKWRPLPDPDLAPSLARPTTSSGRSSS